MGRCRSEQCTGGDFWRVRYRSLDTLDVLSLSRTNTPGRNDSHGNILYGNLATDRPNVFKVYGSYTKSWGRWGSSDIGTFFYGASGTPLSTLVTTTNQINPFVNGRGDLGRTPHVTQTDLMIAHEFAMGETKRIRFEANATNVFNQETARGIFTWLNRGVGTPGGASSFINLSNTNLFKGYDYNALIPGDSERTSVRSAFRNGRPLEYRIPGPTTCEVYLLAKFQCD